MLNRIYFEIVSYLWSIFDGFFTQTKEINDSVIFSYSLILA